MTFVSISYEPMKNIFHMTIIAKSLPMKFVMWGNKRWEKEVRGTCRGYIWAKLGEILFVNIALHAKNT